MTTSHRKELPRCIFLANYVQTSDLVVVDVLQKPLVHFPVSCLEQSKPGDHDDDVVLHGGGDGELICQNERKTHQNATISL